MSVRSKDKRDVYYYRAKCMGYRARSAFKLLDIDRTYHIFEKTSRIIDLCAAPGSWSQVLSQRTEARIVAIDVQEMLPIEKVVTIKEDITSTECLRKVIEIFGNQKADLVVCDGAPDVTGFHDLDEFLQIELLKAALSVCIKTAREGSTFVAKMFQGEYTGYVLSHLSKFYDLVEVIKPNASKNTSVECFVLCRGMRIVDFDPLELDVNVSPMSFEIKSCGDDLEYTLETL